MKLNIIICSIVSIIYISLIITCIQLASASASEVDICKTPIYKLSVEQLNEAVKTCKR